MTGATTLWVDATAGVAGDMLLGALVDAGVPLDTVDQAVRAVVGDAVRLEASAVTRNGLRATKVDVTTAEADPPHRTWAAVRDLIGAADLPEEVRSSALAVFARLAQAEGQVHGIDPDEVHFHEVGALDAVADVVGTCAGVHSLGAARVVVSPIAVGSGTTTSHHGVLPVPVPAVLEMADGWAVLAGGEGELATPTGVALLTTLATASGPLPAMRVSATGVGAGSRDTPGRANVVRLVLGSASTYDGRAEDAVLLETNVDDLDPRVWPAVLAHLMSVGAADAWLTPVLMKKGRPGHTLHVLTAPADAARLTDAVLAHTSTLGVRRTDVTRDVLDRTWVPVAVAGGTVRVKVGHRGGRVLQATAEYDDVAALAAELGEPVSRLLDAARAAAHANGLTAGAPWPARD